MRRNVRADGDLATHYPQTVSHYDRFADKWDQVTGPEGGAFKRLVLKTFNLL